MARHLRHYQSRPERCNARPDIAKHFRKDYNSEYFTLLPFEQEASMLDLSNTAEKIGFEYTTLSNLLKNSDVISLNLPLTYQQFIGTNREQSYL